MLLATRCDHLHCQYFWAFIQPEANSAWNCLFLAQTNVVAEVVADIVLSSLFSNGENVPNLPSQLALMMSLDANYGNYWAVVVLIIVSLLILIFLMFCACIFDTLGFKRQRLLEKVVNEKFGNAFWRR